jgi:oligoribonuclease
MTTTDNLDRLIWVDIETFGLDSTVDPILEIGFRTTDLDLETVDDRQLTVWSSPFYDNKLMHLMQKATYGDKVAQYVLDMHTKSGLWEECRTSGADPLTAEKEICEWLSGHGIGIGEPEPLCGSSVQFDRSFFDAQMPSISDLFSYRNIDISTLKELCRRYNPRIYDLLPPKQEKHRVLDDLDDTIKEALFYKENFLWV